LQLWSQIGLQFFFLLFVSFKVFDASTNKWDLIDHKQHTDVYEKTIEHQVDDDLLYRRNITDETNIINNLERNLLQEKFDEKHTRTTDSVDYIRSDHLIDESISTSDVVNVVDVKSRKDTLVSKDDSFEACFENLIFYSIYDCRRKPTRNSRL
jgi:hypothetical protein